MRYLITFLLAGCLMAQLPAPGGGSGGVSGSSTPEWTSPSLNFGTLLDMACGDLSFTATGLTVGTQLTVTPYAAIGVVSVAAWATATDVAKIRVCNSSGVDVAVSGLFMIQVVPPGYLAGSATLDFPSIIAGGTQSLTMTITGATTAMGALVVPPAAFAAGLQLFQRVTSANTVTLIASNLTTADIDPASGSFSAMLIQ